MQFWAITKPHSSLWLLHGNLILWDEYIAVVMGQCYAPLFSPTPTSVQNANGTKASKLVTF